MRPGAKTDLFRKPPVCDARAVVEGRCVIEQFREELAKAPEIPKWVALDAHAELLAKWLRIKSAGILFHPSTPSSKTVDYQTNLCSHCAEATNASRAECDQR